MTSAEHKRTCGGLFTYRGGEAKCQKCGWYAQPDGCVTRTVTARGDKLHQAHRRAGTHLGKIFTYRR